MGAGIEKLATNEVIERLILKRNKILNLMVERKYAVFRLISVKYGRDLIMALSDAAAQYSFLKSKKIGSSE